MAPGPRRPRGSRQPRPPVRSLDAQAKADLRAENRRLVEENGGVHPDPRCPHGTVYGYDTWICRCDWVPGTEPPLPDPKLGCKPVGVAAADRRRRRRRLRGEGPPPGSALAGIDGWNPGRPAGAAADALDYLHTHDTPGDPADV